jgi:hypothetical protein
VSRWFRVYLGAATDPKYLALARRAGTTPGVVASVWWALMDEAAHHDGSVAGFDAESIAAFYGYELEDVAGVVAELRQKGMVTSDDRLASWEKRNGGDYSTERVRRHRERERARREGSDETRSTVAETVGTVTETEGTVEERRGEERTTTDTDSAREGETVVTGETRSTVPGKALAPRPQPLPAVLVRNQEGVTARLAAVHAELASGARDRLSAEQARTIAAETVFGYWAAKTGRGPRTLMDPTRESRIVARLKENGGDVGELFYAIDGALVDPWHNGTTDGIKHLDIDHIFRNRERVEKLANLRPDYRAERVHKMVTRYMNALSGGEGGEG